MNRITIKLLISSSAPFQFIRVPKKNNPLEIEYARRDSSEIIKEFRFPDFDSKWRRIGFLSSLCSHTFSLTHTSAKKTSRDQKLMSSQTLFIAEINIQEEKQETISDERKDGKNKLWTNAIIKKRKKSESTLTVTWVM
ncbi:hypothetical protein CEXT_775971 [Caerostris extrusa]|uniref:Uncharacterized protein n=1 Tax=Caerostris extrusa TaxID=172846 RepID=A0AAV4XJL5_CAEEX|nr:hypothetical protein CEXT_775971 [Caerostris extrusa]